MYGAKITLRRRSAVTLAATKRLQPFFICLKRQEVASGRQEVGDLVSDLTSVFLGGWTRGGGANLILNHIPGLDITVQFGPQMKPRL